MEPLEDKERTLPPTGTAGDTVESVNVLVPEEHELDKLNPPDPDFNHSSEAAGDSSRGNNSSQKQLCQSSKVCLPCLGIRDFLELVWKRWGEYLKLTLKCAIFTLFIVYIAFAFKYEFGSEHSVRLLVFALIVVTVVVMRRFGGSGCVYIGLGKLYRCCLQPCQNFYHRHSRWVDVSIIVAIVTLIVVFIIVDVAMQRPHSLISVAGIAVFVTLMYMSSHQPRKVVWRPVCWGLLLQFVFALLVLRTSWGRNAFSWMSARVTDYMDFTKSGVVFVFGDSYIDHYFAFRVMSTIIYFSATIGILYYLGVMQVIIRAVAKVMRVTMATGAMETFHAAVNIFCGWAESIMVIRPFLDSMTLAELHSVMTNGFATVAGGTLAAYILYGVDARHLISASFMSAPAALAMSKLFYPTTIKAKRKIDLKDIGKQGSGVVDAASLGAVAAVGVVSHILVTVIAFISLLAFLNSSLRWFGDRIGLSPPDYPPLTFQLICSYLLWPVVYLLGVPMQDCRVVARLLGVKIFINEFIAYADLGKVRANRIALENHVAANGTFRLVEGFGLEKGYELLGTNQTLVDGVISPRSEMLATYALCGFSDLVALGMQCAALSTVAPCRRQDILQVAPRALVSGIVACLLTACMAGLVTED